MTPLVSIVMPCFQQIAFLEEAVRSVLDQDFRDAELVVMDPGSTDGSRELLTRLQAEYGERLRLCFAEDDGQSDAINKGMALANGTILGWLNSDDRLRPGALQVAATLGHNTPQWLYGRAGIIDASGKQIARHIVWYKNLRGNRFSVFKLLTENFIPQMATFWNRAMWETAGGVATDRHLDMDYDIFMRFALTAAPVVSPENLADFRVHSGAKSSLHMNEQFAAAQETARKYAAGLGFKGKLAYGLHRLYAARTKLIYTLCR